MNLQVIFRSRTLAEVKKHLEPFNFVRDIPLKQLRGHHLYVREAKYPRGTLIIGRVHKYAHVFYIVSGKITIWDSTGKRTLTGPLLVESAAGIQRIGYAHTDVICMNMHGCAEPVAPTNDNAESYFTDEEQTYIEGTCVKTSLLL